MTLATGMLDAMTFTTYRVFASKQTGNTLFLALYVSPTEPQAQSKWKVQSPSSTHLKLL